MESKDKSRVVINSIKPVHQSSSEERSKIRTQHRRADEELVKHMSNVPSYLQGMDQPDNLQSKALNFGVIDWGRLEKWAYDQRPSLQRTAGGSKSASQSCRHRTSVPRAHGKKPPSSVSRSEPSSTRSCHTEMMDLESTDHVTGSSDSRASSKHKSASKSKGREEKQDQFTESSKQPSSKSTSRRAKQDRSSEVFEQHSSKFKGIREKHEHSTKELVTSVVGRSGEDELNANCEAGRELSPRHHSGAGLSRTKRCPRDGSSMAAPNNSHAEKAIVNDTSRKSPLRRMLGPLLKPKNLIQFSGPVAASSEYNPNDSSVIDGPPVQEEPTPRRWSFDATLNFFSSQEKGKLSSSGQIPLFQGEKHEASMVQALLQFTWKDGLPLFTLTSDGRILVATLRKKITRAKGKFECVYTILSVHEVNKKKKSRGWASQGNKDKHSGFVSNVVGQLKVSCSELVKGGCVVKEFVLFGAKLTQEPHEPFNSVSKKELAAVVVKMPKGKEGTSLQNLLQSCMEMSSDDDKCTGQIQQGKYGSISSSRIAIILPSGDHGYSATAEPTPLIERWKSGGQCDCGGWDEGCKLTILTGEVSGSCDSSQASHGTDCTNPSQLFVQGGSQDKRRAFSIFPFKEGIYMLNFGACISSLQAFAISLAILHNCNSGSYSQTGVEPVTNYVQGHPPPSPVGRA